MSTRVNSRCGLLICIEPVLPAFMLPLRQRPPPGFRDPYPRYLDRLAGGEGALWRRSGEPSLDHSDHQIEAEAMRHQEGGGAPVLAVGEQFEETAFISGHRASPKREPRSKCGALRDNTGPGKGG